MSVKDTGPGIPEEEIPVVTRALHVRIERKSSAPYAKRSVHDDS